MLVPRLVSSILLVAFAPIAMGLGGCGGSPGQNAASHALKTPELPTDKQAKCRVAKSQSEPLIVEWPDAARGRLESISRRGLVAVRYEGCELSVLSRCTVKSGSGGYGYSPITRKQSTVRIKDADELYANMPVGAVKLESKLQSAGQLNVQMTIVGRFESTSHDIYREDLEGDCGEATHVIAALTVGSFTFSAGSDAEIGGGANVMGAGAGGKSTAARETIQHDGDESACMRATIADKAPPEGCGALLQIEVMPLAKSTKAVAPIVAPVPTPAPSPSPDPALGEKSTAIKAPTCKRGEHVEDGVCVKGTLKTAPVPVTKPSVASSALFCSAGQHPWNGRCVDDEPTPEQAAPAPPPSCVAGTHLENGFCVLDSTPRPAPYPQYNTGTYGETGQPQDRPNPWRGVLAYVAIGTGISASALGLAALSAAGKAAEGCDEATKTCTPEAAQSRDSAKTMAVIADVSLGLTVLSIIGIFLLPAKVKVGAAASHNGVAASAAWRF
ncbi:MAG TPA: hypothetical protein VM925_00915 [Labilithrix sp.]|nr:hypothetical protein [Labilithrix sp.]